MKCFVTGGTGLVGSNLTHELIARGDEVIITGHETEQEMPGVKCLYPGIIGIDWDALGKVDVVFHQAAINGTRVTDRAEVMRANLESSKVLFERVVANGCKRIVYASSTAVYGMKPAPYKESGPFDLNTPYAESKKMLDDFAMEFASKHPDVTVVGLRYCNIYGRGENHKGKRSTMIYQFAHQMLKGNPRLFKHGEQKRDYIYVKDVVSANLLAAKAKESCVLNCGTGWTTTFNRLVEILNGVLGTSRTPEYIDNPFVGAYQEHTECDMSLAKAKTGFVPKWSVEEGIADYYSSGYLLS
jgi:ADP-L-glycero-D-manno-heptose 6-epimerase